MSKINLPTPVDYDECEQTVCVQCQGRVFVPGLKMGTLPAGHPKNPTPGTLFLEFNAKYCKDCGHVQGEKARIIN